jgi:hypothetical protein
VVGSEHVEVNLKETPVSIELMKCGRAILLCPVGHFIAACPYSTLNIWAWAFLPIGMTSRITGILFCRTSDRSLHL